MLEIMNNRFYRIVHLISIAAAVASFSLIIECKRNPDIKIESIAEIQKRDGFPVRVVKAKFQSLESYEMLGGTAEGYYQTTLCAGLDGKISEIKVNIGAGMQKGASLMTIEPDGAQNYNLARKQYEDMKKSRERVKALAEQGGVPQELIDQVETGFSTAKDSLIAIRKSQFVIAPFEGTVVNIFSMLNSKIQAGADLITIADLEKIRVPMKVSDCLINQFKTGQVAYAIVGNDTVKGVLDEVPLSGNDSHVFTIKALFSNPKKIIKPGMYIPVKVVTSRKNKAVVLPIDAVFSEDTDRYIFIVNGNIVKKSIISVGIRNGNSIEVLSGITDSDLVVESGASLLSNGSKIKIVE